MYLTLFKYIEFCLHNAATFSLIYIVYQPVTYGDPSPNITDKNIVIEMAADIFSSLQSTAHLLHGENLEMAFEWPFCWC